ncbi:MAG: putative capsid protein [Cressdnaviricota sp.]|nr:MAG: putative capsid protein [Cressdnaviricota sp.]
MAFKRKRITPRYNKKKRIQKRRRTDSKAGAKKMIQNIIDMNLETKNACLSSTDGVEIAHNNFVLLYDKNLIATTQGVFDPQGLDTQCRIGDKITLKGVSIKLMLELNERYSDVTFRMLVVKHAKGDTPTRATLFNNLAGNKMLDTINRERYTILYQKYVQMKSPNFNAGRTGGVLVGEEPFVSIPVQASLIPNFQSAGAYKADSQPGMTRATKLVSIWIPGKKFGRGGVVQYENQSAQPKFFDYSFLIYAYANFSTYQDIFFVGRVNDSVKMMYYKDG